jgi:5-hydroxyisourate hydrolase-like protein (transthyretin family)
MKGVAVGIGILLALVVGAIAWVLTRPEPAPIPHRAAEPAAESPATPPKESAAPTKPAPAATSKPEPPKPTAERPRKFDADVPPAGDTEKKRGSISGRVIDSSGQAVAGATVYRIATDAASADVYDPNVRTTSDASGKYSLPVFDDATVDVGAVQEGYMPALVRDVSVSAGEAHEGLDLVLGDGARILGKVSDGSGHGLPGIRIVASPSNTTELANAGAGLFLPGRGLVTRTPVVATTDEKGEYVVRGVVADSNYQVRPDTGQMLLVPGTDGDQGRNVVAPADGVDFTMVRSVNISVKVLDGDSGDPVPTFSVVLTRKGERGASSTSTSVANSPDGVVKFERYLAPGPYTLSATAKDFEPSAGQEVDLEPSDTPREFVVRLRRQSKTPSGALVITLKDESGQPVSRAHAFAMATEEPSNPGRYGSAQAVNGVAEIKDLETGHYRISIQPQGPYQQPITVEADVRAGESTPVDVLVPNGGKIGIDIKDAEGHYLTDVRVQVVDSTGAAVNTLFVSTSGTGQTMSRSDGVFFPGHAVAGPLPAGVYTLTFWCSGFLSRSETADVRQNDETPMLVVMEPTH